MEIIKEIEGFTLYRPYNSWDMNYHLIAHNEGLEYLIDIGDVYKNENDSENYGGIEWNVLKELSHMDYIKSAVWKTKKIEKD